MLSLVRKGSSQFYPVATEITLQRYRIKINQNASILIIGRLSMRALIVDDAECNGDIILVNFCTKGIEDPLERLCLR
ncbi:hypothetical protein RLIN73S_00378 [Rhodanobacter lindaniclasticus]